MTCGDSGADPYDGHCEDVLDRVYEVLDSEVTPDDLVRIRVHLEECAPCLRRYDLEQALKELVRRSCRCEPAPVDLRVRIMARITEIRTTAI